MLRDFQYAVRTLLKSPGFTLVAVSTLALGIAANTAIFSAVDAVLLHPLPYAHAEQLVSVTKTMPMFDLFQSISSGLDFLDYRAQTKVFAKMAAIESGQFNLTGDREPERIAGFRISASIFPMLGIQPILGRAFTTEEEQWGRNKVVLLSEPFWKSRFGGDRNILGRQIELDGEGYTVIGVVQPMLAFVGGSNLLTPLSFSPEQLAPGQRGHQNLDVVGRLNPGVSLIQAAADLQRAAAQMTKQSPGWYPQGWSIEASPLAARVSGPIRTPLLVLVGAVALVLLIGCANVANLLLVRASARQKEITIRTALGARRGRIVAQLLAESSLIALTAGAMGLMASAWILDLFERFGPQELLRGQHLQSNVFVAGFSLSVSLLATIVFGLAPAIAASRADLNDALKTTSRGSSANAAKQRLRSVLIAAEVALSLTLLISAGLLIRSFARLQEASPGFDTAHLATFRISLPVLDYRTPARIAPFYDQLLQRLGSLPGVTAAGAVSNLPFSGSRHGGSFSIIGRPWGPSEGTPDVSQRTATPGYFAAMRIRLLKGRIFSAEDGDTAQKVAIVDEPFVHRFFAQENPIGKRLSGPDKGEYAIVGVVGGVKHASLSEHPEPTIYYCSEQAPARAMAVVVRTAGGDPLSVTGAVRQEMAALDRNLPIYRVSSMEQLLSTSLNAARFSTTLLSVFAGVALLLAAIGIYGVVSYSVSQRGQEIGIRMALGAKPGDAVRMILRQGSAPVLIGIVAGFLTSLAATRALSSLLYGVSATDPVVFLAVSIFLAAIAGVASYLPARKATKVDPMTALRYE